MFIGRSVSQARGANKTAEHFSRVAAGPNGESDCTPLLLQPAPEFLERFHKRRTFFVAQIGK